MEVIRYFAKNLFIVLGVVLVWRGVWYLFDELDEILLGGRHFRKFIRGLTTVFSVFDP